MQTLQNHKCLTKALKTITATHQSVASVQDAKHASTGNIILLLQQKEGSKGKFDIRKIYRTYFPTGFLNILNLLRPMISKFLFSKED